MAWAETDAETMGVSTSDPISEEEVERLAAKLQDEPPEAILKWAVERFGSRLAVVSNFGPSTVVLIHHLAALRVEVPVLHINTGFEFAETAEVGKRLQARYGVEIRQILPDLTVEEQAAQHGPELYRRDPDYCCYLRKVLPLEKALVGFDAWVTGVRKSQTVMRQAVRVVEWDPRHEMMKINPMAEWTSEQVWEFIRAYDIPHNALHDLGYPSIGCWPCTRPVAEGEDERAGRWGGITKTECGIHLSHFVPSSLTREGH